MKTLAEIVKAQFEAKGFETSSISISNTDYGTSCYFKLISDVLVDGYIKVRVSDHDATNVSRMSNEIMIFSNSDIDAKIESAEKIIFSERFCKVTSIVINRQETEVQPHQLAATDEIIGERIAKSGNLHFSVIRSYQNQIVNLVRK